MAKGLSIDLRNKILSRALGISNIANSAVVAKDVTTNFGDPVNMFTDSIDKILPITFIKSLFNIFK